MNPFLCRLPLLVSVAFLASCVVTPINRIERNPELYASLSAEDQQLVQRGQLREGMPKGGVFLAVGKPDRVVMGKKEGKEFERWSFVGQQAVWTHNYGLGWGGGWGRPYCGGYGYYGGGPSVTYVPYEAATVDFVEDRVVGWASTRR